MSTLNDIRQTIIDIAHQNASQRTAWHIAKVVSIDNGGETCTVSCDNAQWTDVRLTAIADGNTNFKVYPTIGSMVMVADLSNGQMADLAVIMFSQFSKMEFGSAEHTAVNGDILKQELDKLSNRVDLLYNAIKNGQPAKGSSDGGEAYQSTMLAILGEPDEEDWNSIQDENIKHG